MCVKSIRRSDGAGPSRFVRIALIILVLGDLGWVAYGFNPIVPARIVFPEPPDSLRRVASNLGDGRIIATDEILAPDLAMVYGLRDLRGYDFPLDSRWATLFRRLGWMGQEASITLLPRDQTIPCVRPLLQSVLDKCAVRFLYTNVRRENLTVCDAGEGSELFAAWPLVQSGPGAEAVYQNPAAYPRAYFARRVSAAEPATALAALLEKDHDLRQQSFVENLADLLSPDAVEPPAIVTIQNDGAEEVELHTQSFTAGLLVLSDRYDPAWHVEIDGRAAQSLRTNYLFRGVVVPPGEHVVRWTYRPAAFVWGSIISVITLVVLLAIGMIPPRKS
jgi:hypothetical protein